MVSIASILLLVAPLAAVANAQQCSGNTSMCPGGQDGEWPTYLQCNSQSGQYELQNCASGQVCYANPNKPGTAMCGLPGTGGQPGQGSCTGNTAKCVSASGEGSVYYQCENWSGQYVPAHCPAGLKCYNNAAGTGVSCHSLIKAIAQQCTGNSSKCPNNQDGVSPTYLQCNSWSHTLVSQNCPTGQVCYANPNKPDTAMCGLPGTGGDPAPGKCTGDTAKCVSPSGQSPAYYQCNRWDGQYQNAQCPNGLKCYNNASNTGVYCN